MAKPYTYDFKDCLVGDTIDAISFKDIDVDGVDADLTGVAIRMQIKGSSGNIVKDLTVGNGLTLIGTDGVTINPFILNRKDTYKYDIQFTFAGGVVRTWFKGSIKVLDDVTE